MPRLIHLLIGGALFIRLGAGVPAHETNSSADSLQVFEMPDSIVVVANRFQTSIKNLAYSYETIPRVQIQAMASHSALELVDFQYPTAFVLDKKVMGYGVGTGGGGQLFMRGQGGQPNSGVLVLLNGHPDFMGLFGHPLPDVYGMDDIEQIEILAGPASTVFGDHAMGGVINLVTRPSYDHSMRISAEGGSYGTFKYGLNLAHRFNDRQGAFLTIRQKKSDGHIAQSSFESLHLQAGWQYRINQIWNVSVQGRYVPYRFDDPSRGNVDNLGLNAFGEIKRGTAELVLDNASGRLRGSTQAYTNLGRHRFYDGYESDDYTYGFSSYQHLKISRQLNIAAGTDVLHFGGQAGNDFARLPNGKPVVNPDEHQLSSLGVYGVGFYAPIPILTLKAGLRYQYNTLPLRHLAPMAGITLNALPNFKVYANYQSGFRSPTLMELYLFPSANEKLEQEQMHSTELGMSYAWQGSNELRFTLFRNDVDNIIQTLPNQSPPPRESFRNSGEAIQWGWETMLRYRLTRHSGLQLSYGYLDPDHLTAFNPQHQFKYMLFINRRHLQISLYGKYVQDLFAENDSRMGLPDYHLLNGVVTLTAGDIAVYLKMQNILNRTYSVLPDYRAPGRNARIGFRFSL